MKLVPNFTLHHLITHTNRRELVLASPDRPPNKEKLATYRVAGLCATLPTGEVRIYSDGRGHLCTGLALASAPVV